MYEFPAKPRTGTSALARVTVLAAGVRAGGAVPARLALGRTRPFATDGTVVFNGGVVTAIPATLTEASLRSAAGERSFERGMKYVSAVERVRVMGDRVVASVRGTDEYQVLLMLGGAVPRGECSCPYGREGFFCKHCVAAGIAALRGAGRVPRQHARGRSGRTAGEPAVTARGRCLTSWLDSLSRDDLYVLVLEEAAADDGWRARLELRAAAAAGDAATVRARAGHLLEPAETGSRAAGGPAPLPYARLVREVAMAVGALAGSGHPADARAVAELAIRQVAAAAPAFSDDQGLIAGSAADLVASHLAACTAARADPLALADFLAERVLAGGDVPAVGLGDYAAPLGTAGLRRLRERLTAAWQAAGHAGRAEQDALESLLRLTGDTDALIAVISAGVEKRESKPVRIAAELERAGRQAEALSGAERDLRAAGHPDSGLHDFAATRYAALGRAADALAVRREQFGAVRDLAGYRLLREAAEGAGDWPATREWALGLLRADAAGPRSAGGPGGSAWSPDSVLIDALTDDGDLDAAWKAAPGLASGEQWLRLADLAAATRPGDALAVYRRQIESLRHETGERAYLRLARLLESARACHRLLGTDDDFEAYLAAVREGGKRKRRLITILDNRQLR